MTRRRRAGLRAERTRGAILTAYAAILTAIAAILTLSAGCGGTETPPFKPILPPVPNYTLDELRAAPELEVKFGGIVFAVDAELWRDFMPVSPPDGGPLVAFVEATAVGETAFPGEVAAVYLWVLKDVEVWGVKMEYDPTIPRPAGTRMYVARDGPKWGPGISVEVVVGFRTTGGDVHLVRIPSVPIQRSD